MRETVARDDRDPPREVATILKRLGPAAKDVPLRETIRRDTFLHASASSADAEPSDESARAGAELPALGLDLGAGSAAPEGGDFAVMQRLGVGGMGVVFLGEQRSLGRDVAMKTVNPFSPPEHEGALVREARVLGKLEHPKIPPVYALGTSSDGRPIVVMRRIQGTSWAAMIEDDDHDAWSRSMLPKDRLEAHVRIAMAVAEAASFAHDRAIVHRDIKPENVMIGAHGEVYLVDWGIAETAGQRDGRLLGTPCLMAPEMFRGEEVDPKMDVYLLGASLYVALTKKPLRENESFVDLVSDALGAEPLLEFGDDVPHALRSLVISCVRRDPAARPASAAAFRAALDEFFRHRASIAICAAADERLAQLRSDDGADPVEERRLATEARFGFLEALREWPQNPAAPAGLAACARHMAEVEIARANVDAARTWLSEAGGDDDLAARLADLERRQKADRIEHERLVSFERAVDPAVAARAMRRMLAVLSLIGAIVGVVMLAATSHDPLGPARWTFLGGVPFVLAGLLISRRVFKETLAQNRLARGVFDATIGVIALMLARRAVVVYNGEALATAIRDDLFTFAIAALVTGMVAQRMWLIFSTVLVASAALVHLYPGLARIAGNLAPPVALGMVWVYSVVDSRRAAKAARS